MSAIRTQISYCLLISVLLCVSARSDDSAVTRSASQAAKFSKKALLGRFDKDGDGRLRGDEKRALRAAFGGMDVPLLADAPYNYSQVDLPGHVQASRLREADNTPEDNPLTDQGATLGRVLFYDKQLSRNNTIACASCHEQEFGFTDTRRFSLGFNGGQTGRNAMGLANTRYTNLKARRPGFFWDERAPTLEAQALAPIQDKVEMGMTLEALERKLQRLPYYPDLFEAAFGSETVTSDRIAKAIAQFMRSLVSLNSRFDQGASAAASGYGADFDNFTAKENLGKSLFIDGPGGTAEFGCAHCHLPPTFNMNEAKNNGLDLEYKDPGLGGLDRPSNDPFTPSNTGKFKAPSLRNVELTAPYMHDGRFKSLEQVIEHYSAGVHPHENLTLAFENRNTDQATSGMQFSEEEKAALVAFLKTLTDKQFISDPKFSDPFIRTDK